MSVHENYIWMLKRENSFLYRKDMLQVRIKETYRIMIINWLIYVQQLLCIPENILFSAVRWFDAFMVKSDPKVSLNNYALVAVTSMWITNKLSGTCPIPISKLFSLSDGKLSKNEISSMEKSLLQTLEFNMNCPEPLTFLYFYLERENLSENRRIRLGATFLLELFTMLLEFSSSAPSILAAAALHLAMARYKIDCNTFVAFVDSTVISKKHFNSFSDQMNSCIDHLLDFKGFKNEVVAKYSTEEKLYVADDFF